MVYSTSRTKIASSRIQSLIRRSVVRRPTTRSTSMTSSLLRSRRISTRPTARPTTRIMGGSARSMLQSVLPAAGAGAGGVTPARGATAAEGVATGGLGLSLGGIGGDISSTAGGIINQFKSFIPTAVKIIAAVVVLKIVLWLIKGRRR